MKVFLAAIAMIWLMPLAIMIAAGIACSVSQACRRLCREFLVGQPPEPKPATAQPEAVEYPAAVPVITDLAA